MDGGCVGGQEGVDTTYGTCFQVILVTCFRGENVFQEI